MYNVYVCSTISNKNIFVVSSKKKASITFLRAGFSIIIVNIQDNQNKLNKYTSAQFIKYPHHKYVLLSFTKCSFQYQNRIVRYLFEVCLGKGGVEG